MTPIHDRKIELREAALEVKGSLNSGPKTYLADKDHILMLIEAILELSEPVTEVQEIADLKQRLSEKEFQKAIELLNEIAKESNISHICSIQNKIDDFLYNKIGKERLHEILLQNAEKISKV